MRRLPVFDRGPEPVAFVLLDDEDAARFGHRRIRLMGHHREYPGIGWTYLHRMVLDLTAHDGREVDHIDRDRLNCQRSNLRVVTRRENAQNMPSHAGSSSRFRGVAWYKPRRCWQAYVKPPGRKMIKLGYRRVEEEAALLAHEARCRLLPFAEPDPELVKLGLV